MRKSEKITLISLLLLWSFPSALFAQNQLGLQSGVSIMSGDFFDLEKAHENMGGQFSVQYHFPVQQDVLYLGVRSLGSLSQSRRLLEHASGSQYFISSSRIAFVGFSAKWYLLRNILQYNRYLGMITPYFQVAPGMHYSDVSTQTPDFNSGYQAVGGRFMGFALLGEFGLEIGLNEQWSMGISGSALSGFSDRFDGVRGTGEDSDMLVCFNLGLGYTFFKPQRF